MGKRGNGEGSITRRKDGLYMARYTVEAATGSKRKAVYAKTRKEAAEKLTAAMADASKGITNDGGRRTVGAFLTSWLENSVRGSVRKSTYDRNESLCRVQLIPALGRKSSRPWVRPTWRASTGPGSIPGEARRQFERCTRRCTRP
jgi:integrase